MQIVIIAVGLSSAQYAHNVFLGNLDSNNNLSVWLLYLI